MSAQWPHTLICAGVYSRASASWRSFVDDIMMDLNQLFKTVSSKRILDFVKDIGLYNSL